MIDYSEDPSLDGDKEDMELIDIEALFRKARRTREIDDADVQAMLSSANEEQTERLYERLQKLGIQVVSKSGRNVDELAETANILDLEDPTSNKEVQESYYGTGLQDDPVHT